MPGVSRPSRPRGWPTQGRWRPSPRATTVQVKPSDRSAPAGAREPDPRAAESQRLSSRCAEPTQAMSTHPTIIANGSAAVRPPRAFWPTWAWASPAWRWANCCCSDGVVRAGDSRRLDAARRPAALSRRKAKNVIWLFLVGGMSHLESFDPKPALERVRRAGDRRDAAQGRARRASSSTTICGSSCPTTPTATSATSSIRCRSAFKKRGQSGLEISDWWPHLGECVDDLAVVRSMWTTDNNHGAQLQFHTGRHVLEGQFPTIGSWVHYGLGSLNDNLPQFVVLGTPIADCCGGIGAHGANYLGPEHNGVQLGVDPKNPAALRRARHATSIARSSRPSSSLLDRLNRLAAVEYPDDDGAARPDQVATSWPSACRRPCPRWSIATPRPKPRTQLYGLDQQGDRHLRPAVPGGPAAGRAGRAVRADLPRLQRRRRRLGRPRQSEERPLASSAARSISRSPRCSRTSSSAACSTKRSSSSAPSSAARPARRAPTAATIIRSASRS